MASSMVLTVATPTSPPSLRNTQTNTDTSPSYSSPPTSLVPSNSLFHIRYPCLSISTTGKSSRNRHGSFVAACLSSSPQSRTTTFSTKLYVSGLSFRTTEGSLRNAFNDFGQLVEVNLVMDRIANRPRGFAFLRYATEEESKKAIEGMHGKFLDGRVIFVEVAKPRSELHRDFKQTPR